MKIQQMLSHAAKHGIHFPQAQFVIGRAMDSSQKALLAKRAMDAALSSAANAGVPADFLLYYDNIVIEHLTAERSGREMFSEVKKGDWTTDSIRFRYNERTGTVEAYSDYGQGGVSGSNDEWVTRGMYVFQTSIHYGDREVAVSGAARVNLVSDKQASAAETLDIAMNQFYLFGVEGQKIYGSLNDPNLPAAITPDPEPVTNYLEWDQKGPTAVYHDVLKIFRDLVRRTKGLVNANTPLILAVSPEAAVAFGNDNEYGKQVMERLDKYFKNLTIISVPELYNDTTGNTVMMYPKSLGGNPVGEMSYGDKMRQGRLVPYLSSFAQKFVASTSGFIGYQPMGISTMIGV